MSIFKGTLNPIIAAQLKAREKVVSTDSTRNPDFLRYTTGKNGWVRMSSFVNYDSKRYDASSKRLVDDGRYKGDSLSKKYILEGGALYDQGKNTYSLRAGVGNRDGIYASNIDKINTDPSSNKVDRLYGLRPMPGITSVNIMNKSAYGSLREATIQFYAWDKHQLEELEVLYMRTGYSVFLEWGWSEYINHSSTSGINAYPSDIKVENFNLLTLNPFQPGLTEEVIYNKIEDDIESAKGNYDAMLGFVKNFSWQLMPNGGFQCSTTLISRGETIETLKVSSNNNIPLGSTVKTTTADAPAFAYSSFEKIFLNIIGHINETEFSPSVALTGFGIDDAAGSLSFPEATTDDKKALRDQADQVWNDVTTRLSNGIFKRTSGTWDKYDIILTSGFNLSTECFAKACDGKTEGTLIEYMSMNSFIAILNEFFIPYNLEASKKNKIAYIVLPDITPCLASVDSVSIDPTTCLIQNSEAKWITSQDNGFSPEVFSEVNLSSISNSSTGGRLSEFLYSGTKNIGQIGNIYISINKILNIFRNISGDPEGVDILPLLQEVLDACSFALGGINDFKLHSSKNIIQIIDVKYFEKTEPESKFKFDLIGLKSICRDVKINSRIFAEQSTMIGIAAGSEPTQAGNLGDIYSSTQTYFNIGLKDRLVKSTFDSDSPPPTLFDYQKAIFDNVNSLTNYINRNVLGTPMGSGTNPVTRLPQNNEIINAASLLKTFIYQFNGEDVDFKALIPFELEITLDGIGGLVVGQIFTIDKSILPKDYYNKNLGFIITGISHSLQNNDWVTNIKTQICLLNNDSIAEKFVTSKDKLKTLKEFVNEARIESAQNGYLFLAIADYMIENYLNIVSDSGKEIDKELVDDFSNNVENIYSDKDKMLKVLNNINNNPSSIKNYLEKWYTTVNSNSSITKPNFPATFEEFIKPSKSNEGRSVYDLVSRLILFEPTGLTDRFIKEKGKDFTKEQLKTLWDSTFLSSIFPPTKVEYSKFDPPSMTISGVVQDLLASRNPLDDPNGSFFYVNRIGIGTSNISSFVIKEGFKLTPTEGSIVKSLPDASISFRSYYRFKNTSFDELFTNLYTYLVKASNNGTPDALLGSFGVPPLNNTSVFSKINLVKVK